MKKLIGIIVGIILSSTIYSAGESPIALEHVSINRHDRASLLRGAEFFASTCMVCHTMKYMAHNKLAKKAGITLDKMPLKQSEWLFGITPPDLSLIARQRGANWLYTYFHAFYQDANRPTGYNNLLIHNTVMTNIFAGLQGVQVKLSTQHVLTPLLSAHQPHYYQVLELVRTGSMTPEQFDQTTRDLVNFLVYASDPHVIERHHIGIWVLLFLALFFLIVLLLKKEIWKNIKSNKQK